MYNFPETDKKLKARISSYKSSLNKEKKEYGYISDGSGKRYILFSLYLALNDEKKSKEYIEWYENEFSDDVGEPIQLLCWALMLERMNKAKEATMKLAETMLSNLYLIPKILNQEIEPYDIWHSSNYEHIDYMEYVPQEIISLINPADKSWMSSMYNSFAFRRIRERYLEIYHALKNTKEIGNRKQLIDESNSLLNILSESSS